MKKKIKGNDLDRRGMTFWYEIIKKYLGSHFKKVSGVKVYYMDIKVSYINKQYIEETISLSYMQSIKRFFKALDVIKEA